VCATASPPAAAGSPSGTPELAAIFRAHGAGYRKSHALAVAQRRAMRAIENCRTAALGGHRQACDRCGAVRVFYNSCRNRHCPKCQTLHQQRWLQARRSELLPVPYFHVVFTLPHDLNAVAQGNPRVLYDLLFEAASETLLEFGRDPKHLGGTVGITAVLHTWGRNLSQHLHLHCIVTGGALAPDGSRWSRGRSKFLFPVRALSRVFRGKYLAALTAAFASHQLTFAGRTLHLTQPRAFAAWIASLRRRDWVVYCKAPVAGPQQLLDYLGRYTHRVAVSNDRLVSFRNGVVRFRWKDYADGHKNKIMQLPAEEFIRRFLLHVVPDGFMRIRHFGILANRSRKKKLARCRQLLDISPQQLTTKIESAESLMLRLTGIDIGLCPVCRQGRMHVTEILRRPATAPTYLDSS